MFEDARADWGGVRWGDLHMLWRLTVNAAAEQIDVDTEIVLIHWVGHGAQFGQNPVLIPIDAHMPDGSDATMLEDI